MHGFYYRFYMVPTVGKGQCPPVLAYGVPDHLSGCVEEIRQRETGLLA